MAIDPRDTEAFDLIAKAGGAVSRANQLLSCSRQREIASDLYIRIESDLDRIKQVGHSQATRRVEEGGVDGEIVI